MGTNDRVGGWMCACGWVGVSFVRVRVYAHFGHAVRDHSWDMMKTKRVWPRASASGCTIVVLPVCVCRRRSPL